MKDGQTIFAAPCFAAFTYLFPYQFVIPATLDSSELQVKLEESPLTQVTEYYEAMNDISLKDCTVTHLTIPELSDIPDEKPEATLARWSDRFNPISRNPSARFAYTLASEFHSLPLFRYSTPEPVTISYTCESGASGIQTVPFYAATLFNIAEPDDFCSIHPDYQVNNTSSLKADVDGVSPSLHSALNTHIGKIETAQESESPPEEIQNLYSHFASRMLKGKQRISRMCEERYKQLTANKTSLDK